MTSSLISCGNFYLLGMGAPLAARAFSSLRSCDHSMGSMMRGQHWSSTGRTGVFRLRRPFHGGASRDAGQASRSPMVTCDHSVEGPHLAGRACLSCAYGFFRSSLRCGCPRRYAPAVIPCLLGTGPLRTPGRRA